MAKLFKIITCLFMIIVFSCGTVETIEKGINTKANREYGKSSKEFVGKLNDAEYEGYRTTLERELNTTIPDDKAIIISYAQRAPNCLFLGQGKKGYKGSMGLVMDHLIRISDRNNAAVFFLYTQDTFHKDLYEQNDNYIPDSGFFAQNIFTEKENCSAFLVLKPNGEIFKNYGEDNTSDVELILKQE